MGNEYCFHKSIVYFHEYCFHVILFPQYKVQGLLKVLKVMFWSGYRENYLMRLNGFLKTA